MRKFRIKSFKKKEIKTFIVKDEDEITDEIEKSLWEIKDAFDFDTEEIQMSINEYRKNKKRE